MARVGIFGAGWVGLVTGACFAELGHEVVVRDVVPEKIEALQLGEVPFHEVDIPELLAANRERLTFTLDSADLADCRFLFVCVDTPPTKSGDADLSRVWSVVDQLPELSGRAILVMKSTVPVGTGEKIRHGLDERGLHDIGYVSNPEFLAEGTAVRDFMHPDRIAIGAFEPADGDAVAELYAKVEGPILRYGVNSAEMIKLASNAALMTRISFINEIANVCEKTGADVVEVAEGIGYDKRLGPHFLRAGIGYGGSCFPKDSLALKQLASNSGYHFQLLAAVIEVNDLQKRRVIGKLEAHLGPLRGKKIALLGLAFKPDTDDMREAPSIVLAGRLIAEGAEVRGVGSGCGRGRAAAGRRHRPDGRRRRARRRCRGDRDGVEGAEGPRERGDACGDGEPADHRRSEPARSEDGACGRASPTRESGAPSAANGGS